ncbi:alpha/beta fold hydrolase [Planococcus kocurii]|uniref:alpha/beta fold hydrolase n=1 Tax=Planococcus TaxID=1372 RepID=UPI0011EE06D8|nr:alpha/beta fold hydrolase [Planococcus sp. ANT_H30]KAA0958140.1 alpha/beta fold hydrolase [Planococcus sp. ANT_H30]
MNLKNGEFQVELNDISHWIKIEGQEYNTIPLVILHGGPGGNLFVFERTVGPLLSKERTVVYYEQRGSGRSGKPDSDAAYKISDLVNDFKEIVKWLGVSKVDLLGYSFGGELALEVAYALPKCINKIILSGPSLLALKTQYVVQMTGFVSIADSHLRKQMEEILAAETTVEKKYQQTWELVDENTTNRLFFENQDIAKKYRRLVQESNFANSGLMMAALERNPPEVPLYERLSSITQQSLILTGVHDRNTGMIISRIISRELPNSEWKLFNRSAHFPELEETEEFVEEILTFLKNS